MGADPRIFGAERWIDLDAQLKKQDINLRSEETNLIDPIWTNVVGRSLFAVRKHSLIWFNLSYYIIHNKGITMCRREEIIQKIQ